MDNGALLYAQYLDGDDAALEALVKQYFDGLVRFAYCIVRDSNVAEDVVSDAFASLIVRRKRFFGRAYFKTYLYKIVRNKSVDYLRFHRRFVPLEDLENTLCSQDVEGSIEQSERAELLYRCMQELPEQYRNALLLIYIEGFSVEQTAAIVGKSVKQIYNLLARAKQSLKELLKQNGFDDALD